MRKRFLGHAHTAMGECCFASRVLTFPPPEFRDLNRRRRKEVNVSLPVLWFWSLAALWRAAFTLDAPASSHLSQDTFIHETAPKRIL